MDFTHQDQKKTRAMTAQVEVEEHLREESSRVSLNYSENPAAIHLLDVIVSILAQEYVQKAKENPEIFST